jgi:hypothetical protein
MRLPCAVRNVLGVGLLLGACGGHGETTPDAPGPCWPLPSTPGGQVELGTGDVDFEPMPDTLPIIRNASQSDPYLEVHSRIHGIPPGNPGNILDPHNPRTKASVAIEELGLMLGVECPGSLGYVASPEAGAFDMLHSLRVGFGDFPPEQAAGKQARITIEVVGSNKLYAQDTKLVTLIAPQLQ